MRVLIWTTAAIAVGLGLSSLAMGQKITGPPASQSSKNATSGARVELGSTAFDFGEVWQGESVRGEVQIKNIGTEPLTVEAKSSCGCTLVSKPQSPVEPGASTSLTISYDTQRRMGKADQRVTLKTNDPIRPEMIIMVKGDVKPLYSLDPAGGVSFDTLRDDAHATRTTRIKSKYDGPLRLKLKAGQDFKPFEVTLKEIEPGAEYELIAQTLPPLVERVNSINVLLETNLEKSPEIFVPVRAYVLSDVVCSRTMLRMSRLAIAPREEEIAIRSRADRPVKITGVRPSCEQIKYEILPPGVDGTEWSRQAVRVTLPAGRAMPPGNAQLEILTDSTIPRFQKWTVEIQVIDASHPETTAGPAAAHPAEAGEKP